MGSIVNIASTRALQSEANTEAYSASKGGVVALTHALAVSLGPDIRVNCISPGWIAVDDWKKSARRKQPVLRPEDHAQHPVGRVGHPEDIAALAAYLISSKASFITGQNFVVDGGMTKKMIYA
jgi:NAD(P)-dependent dehydrogenase (short-subunit alcohol dehydrogenase family)